MPPQQNLGRKEQPDWIEVGNTEYSCGECGHFMLDRVFRHPDTDGEEVWLACPNCGWDNAPDGSGIRANPWYSARYDTDE